MCCCGCVPQAVVRDVRGLGVMYAPQLRSFTCLSGPKEAIQQRASLPELTALLQVRMKIIKACKPVQCSLPPYRQAWLLFRPTTGT
jgi:hypothetical protein